MSRAVRVVHAALLGALLAPLASAEGETSSVSLTPVTQAITNSTADVKSAATAVIILLTALLSIALVALLYKNLSGNK